jgi:hypothetical protein
MRLILGATALAQGILIALGMTVVGLVDEDSAPLWIGVVISVQLAILAIGLHVVWHARATRGKRWRVAAGALMGGILGVVAMAATTRVETPRVGYEEVGDYHRVPICELRVSFLDHLLYHKVGREVARSGENGPYVGPDDDLNNTIALAVWSLISLFVIHFSFLGAALAFGIRRLTDRGT